MKNKIIKSITQSSYIPFGVSKNQNKSIGELPNSYLDFLIGLVWFEDKFPDLFAECVEELKMRKRSHITITDDYDEKQE